MLAGLALRELEVPVVVTSVRARATRLRRVGHGLGERQVVPRQWLARRPAVVGDVDVELARVGRPVAVLHLGGGARREMGRRPVAARRVVRREVVRAVVAAAAELAVRDVTLGLPAAVGVQDAEPVVQRSGAGRRDRGGTGGVGRHLVAARDHVLIAQIAARARIHGDTVSGRGGGQTGQGEAQQARSQDAQHAGRAQRGRSPEDGSHGHEVDLLWGDEGECEVCGSAPKNVARTWWSVNASYSDCSNFPRKPGSYGHLVAGN